MLPTFNSFCSGSNFLAEFKHFFNSFFFFPSNKRLVSCYQLYLTYSAHRKINNHTKHKNYTAFSEKCNIIKPSYQIIIILTITQMTGTKARYKASQSVVCYVLVWFGECSVYCNKIFQFLVGILESFKIHELK